ncbi:hypothetical protein ACFL2K_04985 [Candidatus Margulisiibacteriota bacterium]
MEKVIKTELKLVEVNEGFQGDFNLVTYRLIIPIEETQILGSDYKYLKQYLTKEKNQNILDIILIDVIEQDSIILEAEAVCMTGRNKYLCLNSKLLDTSKDIKPQDLFSLDIYCNYTDIVMSFENEDTIKEDSKVFLGEFVEKSILVYQDSEEIIKIREFIKQNNLATNFYSLMMINDKEKELKYINEELNSLNEELENTNPGLFNYNSYAYNIRDLNNRVSCLEKRIDECETFLCRNKYVKLVDYKD